MRELMLSDIAAYLPYFVRCVDDSDRGYHIEGFRFMNGKVLLRVRYSIAPIPIESVKLILKPMSMLTGENLKKWHDKYKSNTDLKTIFKNMFLVIGGEKAGDIDWSINFTKWLYENHYDVCGLIELGVAIPYKTVESDKM